ncbi:DUF3881 family protein [Eubacterium oxidoreducens]|uniref:Uncharacterized protein n=1 Tax=Eubacterium oxidoreducens TaxID=1732 RepID=A0A1G6CQ83_EUBOX|nr:DUF3881 family protein [Eubacterium oxidoreducens]SDB34972.1 protein of unknown function [Eubacterium oxidoreducens]
MHKYLQAIGFKNITKEEFDDILDKTIEEASQIFNAIGSEETEIVEFRKMYSKNFGLSIVGEYVDDETFRMEYYFPFFLGKGQTTEEKAEIEKHADKEAYAGICEDYRVGVTLIFYLQNMTDFLNAKYIGRAIRANTSVTLSGLSTEGKILFPVNKTEQQISNTKKYSQARVQQIAKAREGDEEAIEKLTLEDMDIYTKLSKRVLKEDILSIVDTYFMPYGIESDQYSVLGEIKDFEWIENESSKEKVCRLNVDCNNLEFDLIINEDDLMGEPALGRRFKGNIWLQGQLNYNMEL